MTTVAPGAKRLALVEADYTRRFPNETPTTRLRWIDARILHEVMQDNDLLPLTKERIVGFVDFIDALDARAAELGHPQLRDHERNGKAKAYFRADETDLPAVREQLPFFQEVRDQIWKSLKL